MERTILHTTSRLVPGMRGASRQLHPGAPPNWICNTCRVQTRNKRSSVQWRALSTCKPLYVQEKKKLFETFNHLGSSYAQPAGEVSQEVTAEERNHFDKIEEESKDKQIRSPWMREGSEKPPVARLRQAGAMTKGKLLTTPSRMLKLILPLTTRDANKDRKDVEPLALLVHPQQPLSYLERLIQSEIPYIEEGNQEKIPSITFKAQDVSEEDISSGKAAAEQIQEDDAATQSEDLDDPELMKAANKRQKSGIINPTSDDQLPLHAHENTESTPVENADLTPEDKHHQSFVRWSPSTEIGDFVRDASRGKEFAVEIQGAPPIYVGVPSFQDRTYYLRMRLRKTAKRILALADIKHECDQLAHQGAQRVAQGGFAGLIVWWGGVYYATFMTDLGWDVMEPVTYLVGLSGLMGGYLWFLYHNREVSYRSAMNLTVSRRQSQLYEKKGFNLPQWEMLVEEGNRLRREVKMVADEYDVEWDETQDEHTEKVAEELRKERRKQDGKKDKKDKKADDGDD